MDCVADGSYVIVEKLDYMRTLRVRSSKPCVQLGKDTVDFSAVVGKPYESVFKMVPDPDKKKGWRLDAVTEDQVVDFVSTFQEKTESSGQDNRDLVDDDTSQGLKKEEIEAMKLDRVDGVEIVDKLIENSASFGLKTKFSQVMEDISAEMNLKVQI